MTASKISPSCPPFPFRTFRKTLQNLRIPIPKKIRSIFGRITEIKAETPSPDSRQSTLKGRQFHHIVQATLRENSHQNKVPEIFFFDQYTRRWGSQAEQIETGYLLTVIGKKKFYFRHSPVDCRKRYPQSPHPGPRFPSGHFGNPRKTAGFRSRKKYAQYPAGLPKFRRKRHHPMAAKAP